MAVNPELQKTTTIPGFLMKLPLFDTDVYMTTSQLPVNWNGHIWDNELFSVGSFQIDLNGGATASVTIDNTDGRIGVAALRNLKFRDEPSEIYSCYFGTNGTTYAEIVISPELLISGVVDSYTLDRNLNFQIIQPESSIGQIPRIICKDPFLKYCPAAGEILRYYYVDNVNQVYTSIADWYTFVSRES